MSLGKHLREQERIEADTKSLLELGSTALHLGKGRKAFEEANSAGRH